MKKILLGLFIISALIFVGCGDDASTESENVAESETKKEAKKPVKNLVKKDETMVAANGREVYIKGYMPDDKEKHPAVILSHGYNGCHADFTNECIYYAQNGFVAYALDFCGGSTKSKSTGKSTDMTIFTEKEDLLAVFDYVSKLEYVDSENIYLFGGSQGGLVTTLAAEELVDKVKGIALYYPALNIPDDWRNNYKTEEEIPEVSDFWGLQLGKGFFTSIRDFYTFDNIGKFSKKVLIIQGDKDTIVQVSVAERAANHYCNAELVILPGEGHGFTPAAGTIAMEKVLQFMQGK